MGKPGGWIVKAGLLVLVAGCARATMTIGGAALPAGELQSAEPTATQDAVAPTAAPAAEEPINPCLACHSDKQALIDTAKPEEVAPDESSGVG